MRVYGMGSKNLRFDAPIKPFWEEFFQSGVEYNVVSG